MELMRSHVGENGSASPGKRSVTRRSEPHPGSHLPADRKHLPSKCISIYFGGEIDDSMGFLGAEGRPKSVPPSQEETLTALEASRTQMLRSSDPEAQLCWAQDVLEIIEVSMDSSRNRTWAIEQQLRQDAMNIVLFLSDQFHPKADCLKGTWYQFGKLGFAQNQAEAMRCYKRAVVRGFHRAHYRMGLQYELANEISKALKHYRVGAVREDAASCYRMGMVALLGQLGQPQNFQTAVQFIRKAADGADKTCPQGAYILGMLLAGELTNIELPQAYLPQDLSARQYIEKAAWLGFPKALLKMGSAYELCSFGCDFSPVLSLHYNALAAAKGEPDAHMSISRWFLCGYQGLFERNETLAFTHAQKAAASGLPTAEFALGYFFEIGVHVSVDLAEAQRWYLQASQHGNTDARERLEGLSKARMLSRKDHENVALTRIKSRHKSQRAKRWEKLAGQPSTPWDISRMEGAILDSAKYLNIPSSPETCPRDDVWRGQHDSFSVHHALPKPEHRQAEMRSPVPAGDLARSSNGTRPRCGFLNLDLDPHSVSFSAMVEGQLDMAAARYAHASATDETDTKAGHLTTSVRGIWTSTGVSSSVKSRDAIGHMPQKPVGVVSKYENRQRLQSAFAGSTPSAVQLLDKPTVIGTVQLPTDDVLDIGYLAPLDSAGTQQFQPTRSAQAVQRANRGKVAVMSNATPCPPREIDTPLQEQIYSSSGHGGRTPPSVRREQDIRGISAQQTLNQSPMSIKTLNTFQTSLDLAVKVNEQVQGPKTFDEMGVPPSRNESDCLIM